MKKHRYLLLLLLAIGTLAACDAPAISPPEPEETEEEDSTRNDPREQG